MHGYPPGQCKRASASGSIDESVMQQTFQDIINCIDSDGGDCSSNSFRDNSSTASQTKSKPQEATKKIIIYFPFKEMTIFFKNQFLLKLPQPSAESMILPCHHLSDLMEMLERA